MTKLIVAFRNFASALQKLKAGNMFKAIVIGIYEQ